MVGFDANHADGALWDSERRANIVCTCAAENKGKRKRDQGGHCSCKRIVNGLYRLSVRSQGEVHETLGRTHGCTHTQHEMVFNFAREKDERTCFASIGWLFSWCATSAGFVSMDNAFKSVRSGALKFKGEKKTHKKMRARTHTEANDASGPDHDDDIIHGAARALVFGSILF